MTTAQPLTAKQIEALGSVIASNGATLNARTASALRARKLVESPHWSQPNFVQATASGIHTYNRVQREAQ